MGRIRIWIRNTVRGPVLGTNRLKCSPRDEGYLISLPWLEQFIPLGMRTSVPDDEEARGISFRLIAHLFDEDKKLEFAECYLVTADGKLLASVRRPNTSRIPGIYQELKWLGGDAKLVRYLVATTVSRHVIIRCYKFPRENVFLSWQQLQEAHRSPQEIAREEARAKRRKIEDAAAEEAQKLAAE